VVISPKEQKFKDYIIQAQKGWRGKSFEEKIDFAMFLFGIGELPIDEDEYTQGFHDGVRCGRHDKYFEENPDRIPKSRKKPVYNRGMPSVHTK